jgi:hypothetical protein
MTRWSIGFFFALIAFPFVAVWTITQGPRAIDAYFPVFEVLRIEKVVTTDTGVSMQNVTILKRHDCRPDGILYVSGSYSDGKKTYEVLMPAERGALDSTFLVVRPILRAGETITIPEVRIVLSKEMLAKLSGFRFVISCSSPLVGDLKAYTNMVLLN